MRMWNKARKLDRWGLAGLLPMLLLVLALGLACSNAEEEEATAAQAADDEAWAQVESQKDELDAKRAELAAAREAASDDVEDAADAAEEGAAEAGVSVAQLESQVTDQANDFYQALVDYLNANGMVEGEPPTERQAMALRMKSDEDMLLAQEYIDKGGNYPKAISIYEDALRFDPDNAELQAALDAAQGNRYMSEERFAQAEEGMSQDEIRDLLGQPNLSNIRTFPEDNVEAWFYKVDENGSAAAVWFRQRGGVMKAYKVNFEEVVRDGPTEVGGESAEG